MDWVDEVMRELTYRPKGSDPLSEKQENIIFGLSDYREWCKNLYVDAISEGKKAQEIIKLLKRPEVS